MDPQRGVLYRFALTLRETATGAFLINPPLFAGDFRVSKDGGNFMQLATLPIVLPVGSVCVQVQLSAAEMEAAQVVVQALDPEGIWEPVVVEIQPTQSLGADARVLLSSDPQPTIPADMRAMAGNATSPTILDQSVRTMARGVIGVGSTRSLLQASTLIPPPIMNNQFVPRVLIFPDTTLTPALRGQSCDVSASTTAGALTVSELTMAPVVGDTFVII